MNNCLGPLPGPFVGDADFKVHFVPSSVILAATALPRFEHLRAGEQHFSISLGELGANFNLRQRCLFVSHRWGGEGTPDTRDHAQLRYLQRVLRKYAQPGEQYVWVDYSSMPQDTADLTTIHRLSWIVSFCAAFVLILRDDDRKGAGYMGRCWCFYEWLAYLHFQPLLILPTAGLADTLYSESRALLRTVCHPNTFLLLEMISNQFGGHLPLIADHLGVTQVEDMFVFDQFAARLAAFKADDKKVVFANMQSSFGIYDVFMVNLSEKFSRQFVAVDTTPDGAVAMTTTDAFSSVANQFRR